MDTNLSILHWLELDWAMVAGDLGDRCPMQCGRCHELQAQPAQADALSPNDRAGRRLAYETHYWDIGWAAARRRSRRLPPTPAAHQPVLTFGDEVEEMCAGLAQRIDPLAGSRRSFASLALAFVMNWLILDRRGSLGCKSFFARSSAETPRA